MGAEVRAEIKPISGADSVTAGNGQSTGSVSTTATTAKTGDRAGTGRTETGTGRAETGTEKTGNTGESVKQNFLTEDEKRAERNAKRRERYAQQKDGNVKPRKVRKAKAQTIDTGEIDKLIVGVSSVVASRPNMEHWQLTEVEAHTITQPLANILQKYGMFDKVTENSNEIALAVACVSVFAPRVMVSIAQAKAKKPKQNVRVENEVKKNEQRTPKTETKKSSGNRDKGTSSGSDSVGEYIPPYYLSGY